MWNRLYWRDPDLRLIADLQHIRDKRPYAMTSSKKYVLRGWATRGRTGRGRLTLTIRGFDKLSGELIVRQRRNKERHDPAYVSPAPF